MLFRQQIKFVVLFLGLCRVSSQDHRLYTRQLIYPFSNGQDKNKIFLSTLHNGGIVLSSHP